MSSALGTIPSTTQMDTAANVDTKVAALGVPAGSDDAVQFKDGSALAGSTNVSIVGATTAEVLTLAKHAAITNQKTAGVTGETPTTINTGGPNTKGLRVNGLTYVPGTPSWLDANAIAYWKCDEASGNLIDSYSTKNLTAVNAPGTAAGVLNGSRTFVAASSQYFSIPSEAAMQITDIDFTICGWVYLTDLSGVRAIIAKDGESAGERELLIYLTGTGVRFSVFTSADSEKSVTATTFGTPPGNTWFFVAARHRASDNTLFIRINTTEDSATYVGSLQTPGTAAFTIGARDVAGSELYTDGRVDEVFFTKRFLTDAELTTLYGSGTPPGFPGSTNQTSNLIEAGPTSATTALTVGPRGQISVATQTATDVAGTMQAAAAQTTALMQFKDSVGTVLYEFMPVARPTYNFTNVTPNRAIDCDTAAVGDVADALGTLVADLRAMGILV